MLNSSDLNFNPKCRCIKKPIEFPVETDEDVDKLLQGKQLTRRILLGKTLELFDILGLWKTLKVCLKLDLQPLRMYDYDDMIPEESRDKWVENLKLINQARYLQCCCCYVWMRSVCPLQAEGWNV